MFNSLAIYNFRNTIYFWLLIIGILALLILVFLIFSILSKKWNIFRISFALLSMPLIICVIGFFNSKGSGGFEYNIRNKLDYLGYTYNKYNGSYEKYKIHFFKSFDFKTGVYAKIIDNCIIIHSYDDNMPVCSYREYSDLLNIYTNKRINLYSVMQYLGTYTSKYERDSHLSFSVNGILINVFYRYDKSMIEFLIDYREKSYDKEGIEKVNRGDSLIIEHFDGYDEEIDKSMINELFNEPYESFDLDISDNVYTYLIKDH